MSKVEPRVPPVERSEWSEDVRDLFAVMDPDGWEKGPSRNVMYYLARHPILSRRFIGFGRHILFDSIFSDRDRELITLYVAWTTRSDYEWISHVAYGLQVGLTDADMEAVKEGPDSPHWSEYDRNLLRAVDQLRDNFELDDELWATLSAKFSDQEMIELIFTIGNYVAFSGVLNSLRIPLEPGTEALAEKYGLPHG